MPIRYSRIRRIVREELDVFEKRLLEWLDSRTAADLGARGGKARAAALTQSERSAISRLGAKATNELKKARKVE
jgi:hypothetical protein